MVPRSILLYACFALVSGCSSWATLQPPIESAVADHPGAQLRVTPSGRPAFVLENARIEGDSLVGEPRPGVHYAVALADVERVEVRDTDNISTGAIMFGVLVVVGALLVVFASSAAGPP